MILLGTSVGRIFAFNPHKKLIESRFGEVAYNSAVLSIDFLNDREEYFTFITHNGKFTLQNLYDAFDTVTYNFENTFLTSYELIPGKQQAFFSDSIGNILSYDFSFEENKQSFKKLNLYKNQFFKNQ